MEVGWEGCDWLSRRSRRTSIEELLLSIDVHSQKYHPMLSSQVSLYTSINKKMKIISRSRLHMFITYHDTLCNLSSGFIEKEILKAQVQPMILQQWIRITHEMIFTQERMRRVRLTKKTHSKNHTTKRRENSLLEDYRTPHTEHYYR